MKSNPFLFGLVSIMWPFFTNFHFQWRQTPHRRYMKKQTRLLVWGLTSQPQWKPPTVSRVHPLPALPPPLNNQSISGMELELREWGTIKLVERLSAVKKITCHLTLVFTAVFREFRFTSEVPIWLDYHGKHVVIEQVRDHSHNKTYSKACNEAVMDN